MEKPSCALIEAEKNPKPPPISASTLLDRLVETVPVRSTVTVSVSVWPPWFCATVRQTAFSLRPWYCVTW